MINFLFMFVLEVCNKLWWKTSIVDTANGMGGKFPIHIQ